MILDSNIIIYSNQPEYIALLVWLEQSEVLFSVSTIPEVEVLCYHKLTNREKNHFETLFSNMLTLPLTDNIIQLAIRLRQQRKRSIGDAIVAATALTHDLPVVINNVADFLSVEGLTVISLTDILAGVA